jgi:hypothetical protein
MHDPRVVKRLSARDIEALTFIGEGFEVAQYQLRAAIFPDVSEVVVSHFVQRALRNGWIAVERWNGVGINRLRLAPSGRAVLIGAGCDSDSVFVPRRAVASKDVKHTLWINDLRVVFQTCEPRFDALLPAWQLQRRFAPAPAAIPDLLAVRKMNGNQRGLVCACEIDLGGERLKNVFLPKLAILSKLLEDWSDGSPNVILVLTSTPRRVAILRDAFAAAEFRAVRLVAGELPGDVGEAGLLALKRLLISDLPFTRGVSTI